MAALLIGVGALLGVTVLGGLSSNALGGVLAFGSAALLYLVTEELLVEAHSVGETPLMSSLFFAGFLVLLVIEMLL
jgi:zinc transporter, ZIP family